MRKRSRRGKGRGRKPAASSLLTIVPVPENLQTSLPVAHSPSTTDEVNLEESVYQNSETCSRDSKTYGAVTDLAKSHDAVNEKPADSNRLPLGTDSMPMLLDTNTNSNHSTMGSNSSSSCCSNDGDGGSDTGENEPLHTGFMQTGPKSYRVGSTVVNLNNCSEEDVTPEFRDNDICLEVECGENRGSMFMSRLYQGSKGKCIESNGVWFTPNEFQAMSGRGSAKDWKRSIRHQGRSLKLLLSKDVLDVHPAACRCDSCRQLQLMNGKTTTGSSAVDAAKVGSGGDTSGEENKKSCNGTPLGKKRKKAGRAPSATKLAKLSTAKLNPVGISIPAGAKEQEEERMVDIPNLDSPLFKDVPSKKTDSSSDSSSSSGSSSSDDSSSSEDDSEDEETKKESKSVKDNQVVDALPELSKPRTPIKLTISNVGKPSAKVTSSSSRDILESNSSDSESDREDGNGKKANSTENVAEHNQYSMTKQDSSPLKWKPASLPSKLEEDNNLHTSSKQLNNKIKHIQDDSENVQSLRDSKVEVKCDENCVENPVNHSADSKQAQNGKEDVLSESLAPENKSYDEESLLKEEGDFPLDTEMKNMDEDYLLKEEDDNKQSSPEMSMDNGITEEKEGVCDEKATEDETVGKNSLDKVTEVKEVTSDSPKQMDTDMDSSSHRSNSESKYCPDGFILAPTLSKSPEHLRSPLKLNSFYTNNAVAETASENHKDSNGESPQEGSPVENHVDAKTENESAKCEENSSVQTCTGNSNVKDLADVESADCSAIIQKCNSGTEPKGDDDAEKKDTAVDNEVTANKDTLNISEKEVPVSSSSLTVVTNSFAATSDREGQKKELPLPSSPSSTSSSTTSLHINSNVESINTTVTNPTTTAAVAAALSPVKTTSSSSSPILSSSPAATACSTKSSSKPSPSTASTSASGFTNGIPDKENPFITWTKYDDDTSGSVDSHLPSSTLVQVLARAPFPPLALPTDSSMSQISPLGTSLPQLSPLGISPGSQLPRLASPGSQRMGMSPNQSCPSSSMGQTTTTSRGPTPSTSESAKGGDAKNKIPPKSVKRTSRLSNIIDNLRSSKEKQVTSTQPNNKIPPAPEQAKKSTLDSLFGLGHGSVSPSLSSAPAVNKLQSSNTPSTSSIIPSSNKDVPPSASEKTLRDSLSFPHQISADTRQAIRSSLDAARAQAVNDSFNALRDDLDKGKRILENLEVMKNGPLDPYGKTHISDQKSRRVDPSSQLMNRGGRTPSLSSSASATASAPLSSSSSSATPLSRPSSRQSSKPSSSQSYSSSMASSSSKSSSNSIGNALSNSMLQASPSAALTAAHIELNAAAANIMAFQHMYGMQDPYVMKTLMSNPLYLQHMMEFQKQAMDPLMLRQLEMLEAASVVDKSKNSKDQRAAINAQNLLWSAQATMLQHQQMQQLQQLQLHHQQHQLQQQAAAAREKESLDTIAALMGGNKSNNFHNSSKSSGSISAGQSSKFAVPSSSSSSATSNKRPRSNVPSSSMSNLYSRDGSSSADKKPRLSSSQISNASSYSASSTGSSSSSSPRVSHTPNKTSSSSGSSRPPLPTKQDYQDLQAHLSASAAAGLWGFPGIAPPQPVDMGRMSRFFERPAETASSSTAVATPAEPESSGDVLDLSVKPRNGK